MNKRDFIRTSAQASLGLLLGEKLWAQYAPLPATTLAGREDFWDAIRAKYRLKPDYINLENGYYSHAVSARARGVHRPSARGQLRGRVLHAHDAASRTKRRSATSSRRWPAARPRELIITRNTTESLDTVINGYDWKPGDEAVMAAQDYGHMLAQFKLMSRRYGMTSTRSCRSHRSENRRRDRAGLRQRDHAEDAAADGVPHDQHHRPDPAGAEDRRHGARARRGRAWWTARTRSRTSITRSRTTRADYYGASLHKWLGCPLGTGILYVRRDKIRSLWPIYGDSGPFEDTDMMKLNHTGTHPVAGGPRDRRRDRLPQHDRHAA